MNESPAAIEDSNKDIGSTQIESEVETETETETEREREAEREVSSS